LEEGNACICRSSSSSGWDEVVRIRKDQKQSIMGKNNNTGGFKEAIDS
jgi:hypothetical protein